MNYENKETDYYSNVRLDVISLLEKNKKYQKALEIGAAYGETLFYLKKNEVIVEAIGVDIFEDKKNKERYKQIDKYIFENIENTNLTQYSNYFDLIILADVLEHLIEPNKVLEKVYNYSTQDVSILVSIPNIRHYSAFYKIFVKGDFKYEESGIFDYTHFRFYCKKNMIQLFETNNFKIEKIKGSINVYKGKSVTKLFNYLTFNLFESFFSKQYYFLLRK